MSRFLRPLAFALAGLIALGLGAVGYDTLKSDDGSYRVTAYFEKAIGLFENSDVTIMGVAVGKVKEVHPEGTKVRVEMEINDDYKVPADGFAQIVPISVISDRYIEMAPVYDGGSYLKDGAVLDVEDTQIPAELDDVFKQLKKLLDAIEPGKEGEPGALGSLIVELNETLDDRERDLKGTIVYGADLLGTLADSKDNLSRLLINLDDLFGKLSTRASSIGTLNTNMATVFTTLAESRDDLEGTLTNLSRMTEQVGDLVRDHGETLGDDLRIATRITSSVLRHRASVEESLVWLPVVGEKLTNAYHGGEFKTTDVRDNAASARCDEFEDLPGPIKEALAEIFDALCGTERPQGRQATSAEAPQLPRIDVDEIDCEKSVRKIKRELKRIEELGLPDEVTAELLEPLQKTIGKLARRCEELKELLTDDKKSALEKLLEDIGQLPELDDDLTDPIDDLTGNLSAAGEGTAPTQDSPGVLERVGGWFSSLLSFVGGES